jgi:hypothetical protein
MSTEPRRGICEEATANVRLASVLAMAMLVLVPEANREDLDSWLIGVKN